MIIGTIKEIAMTFTDMAPYMLLGLTFAGILHVFIDRDLIAKHLGGDNAASVVKAALLGVPLPLCSCGVLPVAMSLRKGKASDGATVSFLISTPQTGIDSIVATWGMLGPVYAVFRPVAALVMGIAGGLVTILFSKTTAPARAPSGKQFSCNLCLEPSQHSHTLQYKVKRIFTYAFGDFLDDISAQLSVGIVISGIIAFIVPEDFFTKYMGNDLLEMLVMVAVGIPMYICATASIPIAMALMMKGLSPGAAFVFLAVGPATNISFILVIAEVMGRKIVAVYISVLTVFSIIMGYVLNGLFGVIGTQSLNGKLVQDFSGHTSFWPVLFSIVFLIILVLSLSRVLLLKWRKIVNERGKGAFAKPQDGTIDVEGTSCRHCAARGNAGFKIEQENHDLEE